MAVPDYTFKVCIIGEPNVGKTSTVGRFVHSSFETTQVTIGVEMESKTLRLDSGQNIHLNLWDIAGMARVSQVPQARRYFSGCHCILLIYSVVERSSFDSIIKWLQYAQETADTSFEPMVVLVGNKCDMGAQREVTTEEVRRFAEDKNFSMFMETSAKQGTNIEKLFESICKELVELHRTSQKIVNKRKNPSVASAGTVKLESRPVDEKEKTQSCSC